MSEKTVIVQLERLRALPDQDDAHPRGLLKSALEAYLEEYGCDGYTADSFIDFALVTVLDVKARNYRTRKQGADVAIAFYKERIESLRRVRSCAGKKPRRGKP